MHITIIVPEGESLLDDLALAQLPDLYHILGYQSPEQIVVKRVAVLASTTVKVCFQASRRILTDPNHRWFREQVLAYLAYFTPCEVCPTNEVAPGS